MKRKKKFKKIIGILIGILFLSIIFFVLYSRISIYNYDTSKDYQYNFNQKSVKKIELYITDNKITLPIANFNNQTAFIKLKVNTSLLGKFFQPSIKITTSNKQVTHYFEHGAEGIRYLNISDILESNIQTLNITGNRIKIDDQKIELFLFKNINIDKAKILIIAPHPDDAEIAAYGIYAKNPKNSFIITITAGEAGYFKYNDIYNDPSKHSLKKGEIRTWNSVTVPLLSGVPIENSLNLGYFDTTLKEMFANDTAIICSKYIKTANINTFRKLNISMLKDSLKGTSNWVSLVDNLKFLILKIKPDIIVTPHPQIDSHPDHHYATIAIAQALKELKINKGHLFLYTNHFSLCEFYPYGKEGNPITLPPYFKSDLYFNSVFSNSLTKSQQQDKIFALEAMNDLRLGSQWRKTIGLSKITAKTITKEILGIQDSYYRKSVRSNELFFTLPINENTLNNLLNDSIP